MRLPSRAHLLLHQAAASPPTSDANIFSKQAGVPGLSAERRLIITACLLQMQARICSVLKKWVEASYEELPKGVISLLLAFVRGKLLRQRQPAYAPMVGSLTSRRRLFVMTVKLIRPLQRHTHWSCPSQDVLVCCVGKSSLAMPTSSITCRLNQKCQGTSAGLLLSSALFLSFFVLVACLTVPNLFSGLPDL